MLVRTYTGAPPQIRICKGAIDTQMHMYLPGFPPQEGGPGLPPDPLPGPQEYRQTMDWLDIERVIITQGNAYQYDNSCLMASLEAMGDCARGVAVITGETPDSEMQRLADAGIVGARIMDLSGGAIGLEGLEGIDARASAFDWCIAIQFDGSDILDHEPRLSAIQSDWILDHHGKFFSGAKPDSPQIDAVKRLIDKGNCWFKFAGCYESSRTGGPGYGDIAAVAREISAYAPERIVWGTNWPHNNAKRTEDYPNDAELADTVLGWLPDEGARKLALVDNPEKLFKFKA